MPFWDVSPKNILVPEINNYCFPTYLLFTAFCSQILAFTACDCTTVLLLSVWEDYNCFEPCFSLLSTGIRVMEEHKYERVYACISVYHGENDKRKLYHAPDTPVLSFASSWDPCM